VKTDFNSNNEMLEKLKLNLNLTSDENEMISRNSERIKIEIIKKNDQIQIMQKELDELRCVNDRLVKENRNSIENFENLKKEYSNKLSNV
jgi:hypothetical protein